MGFCKTIAEQAVQVKRIEIIDLNITIMRFEKNVQDSVRRKISGECSRFGEGAFIIIYQNHSIFGSHLFSIPSNYAVHRVNNIRVVMHGVGWKEWTKAGRKV